MLNIYIKHLCPKELQHKKDAECLYYHSLVRIKKGNILKETCSPSEIEPLDFDFLADFLKH